MKTCVVEIKDEVNCRLVGLDLDVRKKLVTAFKYENPATKYMPAVRLGRWDGKIAYFQLGGSTFTNLLPEIIPILEKYDYDVELDDQRNYSTTFEFSLAKQDTFASTAWPAGHPAVGTPIMLRDYQVGIVNNFLTNLQCVQEIATGSGKTIMTAALSWNVQPYGRSIVIVPNKSLVTQTEKDYINLGLDVGVYFGDRKDLDKTHTICTWQSLNVLMKHTLDGSADYTIHEFIQGVVCVIVDECFDADSLVLTTTGYVPIVDICIGDQVINYDQATNQFKTDTVVKQHINLTNSLSEKMYELEFDNGAKIQVTGNHKFLTATGWCRADELSGEHEIINIT